MRFFFNWKLGALLALTLVTSAQACIFNGGTTPCDNDCVEDGGKAVCVAPIPVPDTAQQVDGNFWRYGNCSNIGPSIPDLAVWCVAAGGTLDPSLGTFNCVGSPNGTDNAGTTYASEGVMAATATAYINRKHNPCSLTQSGGAWGANIPVGSALGNNCWALGDQVVNGVLKSSLAVTEFSGLKSDSNGACTIPFAESVASRKYRGVACPAGFLYAQLGGVLRCSKYVVDACPIENPFDPYNKELLIDQDDLNLPGFEGLFTRSYRSQGRFLPGVNYSNLNIAKTFWKFSFDRKVLEASYANSATRKYTIMDFGSWPGIGFSDTGAELWNRKGQRNAITVNATGKLITDSVDSQWQFNALGSLISMKRKNGQAYNYSRVGNQLTVTNEKGRSATITYSAGDFVSQISGGGLVVDYVYDNQSRMKEVLYSDGRKVTYFYEDATAPNAITGKTDERNLRIATYNYSGGFLYQEYKIAAAGVNVGNVLVNSSLGDAVYTDALGANKSINFSFRGGMMRPSAMSEGCASCGNLGNSFIYADDGTLERATDARGIAKYYVWDGARNLETRRVEGIEQSGPQLLTRTIETDWHPSFRSPTARRVCAFNPNYTCPSTAVAPNLLSKTQMTYNTRGQLLSTTQTDPTNASNTRISSSTYCDVVNTTTCPLIGLKLTDNGPRTDVTDVTTYAYRMSDAADLSYRKGDLWKITNANAQVVEYLTYDGAGRVLKMKDPNGIETWMSYHPRGWLTTRTVKGTTVALDAVTTFVYTPFGAIERVTQPDGSYTQYSYDQAQRLIAINDGLNNRIDYTLDAAGNRIGEATRDSANVLKRSLAREYDQLSRLRASLRAGVLSADPDSKKTVYSYDANGNQELMTDPMIGTAAGTVSDNDYDPLNRLIKTLQDVGGINAKVEYEYDALDRLTVVKDPKNLNTVYSYDGLSNQTSLNSPDTGVSTFTYDAAGNRKSQTDARGVVSNMTYDKLNRLLTISYPSDTTKNISFTYDTNQSGCATGETLSKGRLTRMVDATGSTKLCYDYLGLVRRKIQVSGGQTLTMQYRYDLAGRLTSLTYPSGAIVNYTRDTQGRLITATLVRGTTTVQLVTNASYLPFGPIDRLTFGNGQFLNKAYDQNYDIDAITGGISYDFSVDEVGNIRQIQSATATQNYGYDKLYRLQDVRDQNQSLIEAFSYDATGNRLSQQDQSGTEAYSYPVNNHHLSQLGPVVRTQDQNGNTLTGVPGFGTDAAGYDVRNRLSSVGTNRYKANFNARGERVMKSVLTGVAARGQAEQLRTLPDRPDFTNRRTGDITPIDTKPSDNADIKPGAEPDIDPTGWSDKNEQFWIDAVATDWVNPGLTATLYDESGQVLSYRRSGSTITHEEIVWFGNTPIARFTSSGTTITAVQTIHTDHLNSPRALANARTQGGQAAGITVWSWDLLGANASGSNAFGSIAANEDVDLNGSTVKFDLRFPGQQYDSETNLNYNYFRDYESGTGRYVESDPIGLRGGISSFGYAGNFPFRLTDRKGLAPDCRPFDSYEQEFWRRTHTTPLNDSCTPPVQTPESAKPPEYTKFGPASCKNMRCSVVFILLDDSVEPFVAGTSIGKQVVPGYGFAYQCCCEFECAGEPGIGGGAATPGYLSAGFSVNKKNYCFNIFFGLSYPYNIYY
jgi:RHS repeat-associated protein